MELIRDELNAGAGANKTIMERAWTKAEGGNLFLLSGVRSGKE